MPETSGGHTHGRHAHRLESPEALRAHLVAVHHVPVNIEATDENWDQLVTAHLAAHRVGECDGRHEPAMT